MVAAQVAIVPTGIIVFPVDPTVLLPSKSMVVAQVAIVAAVIIVWAIVLTLRIQSRR
jgi:hypothetical protein